MTSSGLQVRPIKNLAGHEGFNEVVFDNVFVPDRMLIGTEGDGWAQVTAGTHIRAQWPRTLSEQLRAAGRDGGCGGRDRLAPGGGNRLPRRGTEQSAPDVSRIAAMLNRGENPQLAAANVKDMGALFEQRILEVAHALFGNELRRTGSRSSRRKPTDPECALVSPAGRHA
jgi:acyl-CoA dehydrogenase